MTLEQIIALITAVGSFPGIPKGELIAALAAVTTKFIAAEKARSGLTTEELFEDSDAGLLALEVELMADQEKGE